MANTLNGSVPVHAKGYSLSACMGYGGHGGTEGKSELYIIMYVSKPELTYVNELARPLAHGVARVLQLSAYRAGKAGSMYVRGDSGAREIALSHPPKPSLFLYFPSG